MVTSEIHLSEIEMGETRNQSDVTGDLTKDLLYDSNEEQVLLGVHVCIS